MCSSANSEKWSSTANRIFLNRIQFRSHFPVSLRQTKTTGYFVQWGTTHLFNYECGNEPKRVTRSLPS
uniref:Ovule protein n=1 Tax=Caenorhabditis tropicalis TaxID=1561998 RepID=A0A1I7UMT6_9PELO